MSEQMKQELSEAIDFVINFIEETTGKKASQEELARAIRKYFVLAEIKACIEMERNA